MRCDVMWCKYCRRLHTKFVLLLSRCVCVCVYVHMYFCMYVRRCQCMHTCMDGWTQGRMDEQTDGCMCMRIFICGYCSGCLQASRILAHSTCCMDYVYVLVCLFVCPCLSVCVFACVFVPLFADLFLLFGCSVCLFVCFLLSFHISLFVCLFVIFQHMFSTPVFAMAITCPQPIPFYH